MARIENTEVAGPTMLTKRAPVLAVRLGRGRTGGTTFLDWLIQRATIKGVRSSSPMATDGMQIWPGCIQAKPCSRPAMTLATSRNGSPRF